MKRIAALITILLLATAVFAQEADNKFRTKMFEVHHRSARDLSLAIKGLGSGTKGAEFSWNDEMHTITVRDYPENIAAIEEALGRLDKPMASTPDVEMKISLLIGSKTALPGPAVPEDLEPVVKQLQSTLRYSHYTLLATDIHHSKTAEGMVGSGLADPALMGLATSNPIFYEYHLRNIRVDAGAERPSVAVENFKFQMRAPLVNKGTQYESVGFETAVSIKQNEKVVIGTTTMGDRAVIVVLIANVK